MAGRMPMRIAGVGARRFGQAQGSLGVLARGNATMAMASVRSGAVTMVSLNRSLEQAHGLLQRQPAEGARDGGPTMLPIIGLSHFCNGSRCYNTL